MRWSREHHNCPVADEGSNIMANGEHLSRGGNFLKEFRRGPLARVAGAVAIVASAAGLTAGCESTAAGGGSGSRSVNNVIKQSTTGSPEDGWVEHCDLDEDGMGRCYVSVCDGNTLVSFESGYTARDSSSDTDEKLIKSELIGDSFTKDSEIPNSNECLNPTYGFKVTREANLLDESQLVLSDLTWVDDRFAIQKQDYKKEGLPTSYIIYRESEVD